MSIRSDIIATLAFLISSASAGWSAYNYLKSSEVRVLPIEEVTILRDNTGTSEVPQIWLESALVNTAFGEYSDIIEGRSLTLQAGDAKLVFRPVFNAQVSYAPAAIDGADLGDKCYVGGVQLMACELETARVDTVAPGQALATAPLFELAPENCGLANCTLTFDQLVGYLDKPATLTYTVKTLRDGAHEVVCATTLSAKQLQYLRGKRWLTFGCAKGASA